MYNSIISLRGLYALQIGRDTRDKAKVNVITYIIVSFIMLYNKYVNL
jgi:hypothetical protein